jgi:hypothetical protein
LAKEPIDRDEQKASTNTWPIIYICTLKSAGFLRPVFQGILPEYRTNAVSTHEFPLVGQARSVPPRGMVEENATEGHEWGKAESQEPETEEELKPLMNANETLTRGNH